MRELIKWYQIRSHVNRLLLIFCEEQSIQAPKANLKQANEKKLFRKNKVAFATAYRKTPPSRWKFKAVFYSYRVFSEALNIVLNKKYCVILFLLKGIIFFAKVQINPLPHPSGGIWCLFYIQKRIYLQKRQHFIMFLLCHIKFLFF